MPEVSLPVMVAAEVSTNSRLPLARMRYRVLHGGDEGEGWGAEVLFGGRARGR